MKKLVLRSDATRNSVMPARPTSLTNKHHLNTHAHFLPPRTIARRRRQSGSTRLVCALLLLLRLGHAAWAFFSAWSAIHAQTLAISSNWARRSGLAVSLASRKHSMARFR